VGGGTPVFGVAMIIGASISADTGEPAPARFGCVCCPGLMHPPR
jgi:hypothetical protein